MRKREELDKIQIKDLEVFANHGVMPEEKALGQKFLLSLCMYLDVQEAGQKDDLTKSVSYAYVAQYAEHFMRSNRFELIEGVAEHLAEELLLKFPMLEYVTVEIKKPWAPIGLPLDTVSVEITRGYHTAFLSIGSNIEDRKGYLDFAVTKFKNTMAHTSVVAVSDYIETEPYGMTDQASFLNGALEIRTLLSPQELLDTLHQMEAIAGRKRDVHWGPRTLDVDIIFYDDLVLTNPNITIPHADMANRDFVLRPLMQLCPGYVHPLYQKTVAQLYGELLEKEQKDKG
jgi:dihydroneopterin aldolase/2-amino-4-hydroxy-6-hydroxymethyldihydropteridine diphosphokinase